MPLRLPDIAKGVVSPDYTDEHLRSEAASDNPGIRRRAELLLSVPATQRQNIEAEVTRRTTRDVTHWTPSGLAEVEHASTGSPVQARAALVAAYLRSQED